MFVRHGVFFGKTYSCTCHALARWRSGSCRRDRPRSFVARPRQSGGDLLARAPLLAFHRRLANPGRSRHVRGEGVAVPVATDTLSQGLHPMELIFKITVAILIARSIIAVARGCLGIMLDRMDS